MPVITAAFVRRFTALSPLLYEMEDMKRVHGINERISLENLQRMVQFFTLLMQRWDMLSLLNFSTKSGLF